MLFTSFTFVIFLAIVWSMWRLLPSGRARNLFLLLGSYVFYGAWDVRFLSLIWLSTIVDYIVARRLMKVEHRAGRRALLILSLCTNLGLLGFFKYADFAIENLQALLAMAGIDAHVSTLGIILPVGISFYTFQTISYTVDVFLGRREACTDFGTFALYVAFFPQLVAGPIEKSTHLLPQLEKPRKVSMEDFRIGAHWMLLGYFKKIAVADTLAPMVDSVFAGPEQFSATVRYASLAGFALQIYGDFCGYTLIARGVARWFGVDLMRNFHHPYFAVSPRDFWRRWHISLSTWLRDYLYIPLGGSRSGSFKTCRNLMITMALGGLWHGAAWNFVAWGIYHGIALVICHLLLSRETEASWKGRRQVLPALLTLQFTLVGWWLFRIRSFADTGAWLDPRAGLWQAGDLEVITPIVFFGALLGVYHAWMEVRQDELSLMKPSPWRRFAYAYVTLILVASQGTNVPFIYFQF